MHELGQKKEEVSKHHGLASTEVEDADLTHLGEGEQGTNDVIDINQVPDLIAWRKRHGRPVEQASGHPRHQPTRGLSGPDHAEKARPSKRYSKLQQRLMEPDLVLGVGRIGSKRRLLVQRVIGLGVFGTAASDDEVPASPLGKHPGELDGGGEAVEVRSRIGQVVAGRCRPGKMNACANAVGDESPDLIDAVPAMLEPDDLAVFRTGASQAVDSPPHESGPPRHEQAHQGTRQSAWSNRVCTGARSRSNGTHRLGIE